MFNFFRKKTTLNLDCFTFSPQAYDFAPIDFGINYLPEWWSQTPTYTENNISIKKCNGFLDLYKTSLVVPSWFELELKINDNRSYSWNASDNLVMNSHPADQFKLWLQNDGLHLKLASPWLILCDERVNFVYSQATWNLRSTIFNMSILPGVLNFYDQHQVLFNMFFKFSNENQLIKIPPLTPLAHIHPISDYKIKIKRHLIDDKEYSRLLSIDKLVLRKGNNGRNLADALKKRIKLKNKIQKIHAKPFHFKVRGESK